MDKIPPGWNDPPMMTRDTVTSTKPRNVLNKRVAYPLNSEKSETVKQTYSGNLPPPSICSTNKPTKPVETSNVTDDKICLEELTQRFKAITDRIGNDSRRPEILKRIEVMNTMWTENQFSIDIHNKISEFVDAIEQNNIEKASDIYMSLTMNNAALCSPWIIAFKYIVHCFKAKGS